MSKVAVVYWSGTGHTKKMAEAVCAGAEGALFPVAEFRPELLSEYGAVAFGCPSMGVEQLEESEFEPMFETVKPSLSGRKVGLFGSYGWGDGEWMRAWQEDCRASGAELVMDGVTCMDDPDAGALDACRRLGEALKS